MCVCVVCVCWGWVWRRGLQAQERRREQGTWLMVLWARAQSLPCPSLPLCPAFFKPQDWYCELASNFERRSFQLDSLGAALPKQEYTGPWPVWTALISLAILPIHPGLLDCFSLRRDISKDAIAVPYLLIISLRDPKSDLHHNQNQIKKGKELQSPQG